MEHTYVESGERRGKTHPNLFDNPKKGEIKKNSNPSVGGWEV